LGQGRGSNGCYPPPPAHIHEVSAQEIRLKDWLHPVQGVASKCLSSWLGWRRTIVRADARLTPPNVIGHATAA